MGVLARIERGLEAFARVTSADRNIAADRFFRIPKIPGVRLNHDTALGVAALFACVTVIAKSLAGVPWEVVEEEANGNWKYRRTNSTWRLLNIRPNAEQTPHAFHEAMFIVALLWGAAHAEIEWDNAGRPYALWPLDPERCCPERDDSGKPVLRVSNWDRPNTILDWKSVYTIRGPGIGLAGFDMIHVAAATLVQALAVDKFGLKFYEHGTAMGGIFSTEQNLEQPKIDALTKRIQDRVSGAENAFQFLITTGGMKYQANSQSLRDGQFVDTRYLIIEEVCRWYGVPPHKIAHLLRATFSNIEHQGLEFTRDTLRPWAKRAQQEATYKLLSGRLRVQIDMDELSEGDAKSVADTDSVLVNNGLRNRNELRQKRGWNGIGPDGDLFTVQGAMTTLDKIAAAPAPRTQADPAPADPASQPIEERQTAAAFSLFASAMKRCLTRYYSRALEAADRCKTASEFEQKLTSHNAAHLQHVQEEIDDRLAVLFTVGATFDAAMVRAAGGRMAAEHGPALVASFGGDLHRDIDQRAAVMAQALVAAMKGVSLS